MLTRITVIVAAGCLLVAGTLRAEPPPPLPSSSQPNVDTGQIEQLTGAKGTWIAKGEVFKVNLPRGDIAPTVAGVKMSVPMGLGAWAAFHRVGDNCMVMGDMVLQEDQVNPVMSVALDNGLAVTALHNHFMWDSPRVMFMHVGAMGQTDKLAAAIGKVFAKIKETSGGKGVTPKSDIDASKSTITADPLQKVLNHAPEAQPGGVVKFTFGRRTKMDGEEIGSAMGVNTWASFAGSDDKCVVDGDFVMTEQELQKVLKALRSGDINIVAIHNHMTGEQPRMMFLHFWGTGKAADLAKSLQLALDTIAAEKGEEE